MKRLSLILYSGMTAVNLQNEIMFKKIRVSKFMYSCTEDIGYLMLQIAPLNINELVDGINYTQNYFFNIFCNQGQTTIYYNNVTWDFSSDEPIQLQNFQVDVRINAMLDYTINFNNPIRIELEYE